MVLYDKFLGRSVSRSEVKSVKSVDSKALRYPTKYQALRTYSLGWSCRLQMEHYVRPAMYVTFTFENAPELMLSDEERYIMTHSEDDKEVRRLYRHLLKDIFQRFMKRLRNNLVRDGLFTPEEYDLLDLKYYAITERGDHNTERLHFHVLFFGFDFKTYQGVNKKGQIVDYVVFSSLTECITKSWGLGHVTYNGANDKAINYVTKYIHKRAKWPEYISLKSHGLGLSYLTQERIDHFKETLSPEFHIYGRKMYLPRYIKAKVFTEDELSQINKPYLIETKEKEIYDKVLQFREELQNSPESRLCKYFLIDQNQETIQNIYAFDSVNDQIYFGSFVPEEVYFRCKNWRDDQIRYNDCFTKRLT